ncbi:hypothetical protein J2X65_002039 [Ancylobacter sp. 3268]|uniref:hypothetical protein n=1 Tax=Ancylobacter sp. 3268 TaxID=2817752 RepID=UPI00285FB382|nr:hypothetical protein [Ancylobacter sp. 3268]MDR6952680.1 hypothetical protein [Ancylobacter sp. 3268]
MSITEFSRRDITLKRSKVVVSIPDDWNVADSTAAQKYAKGDGPKFQLALMQRVCRFNGETWTLADIQERIKGKDYLQLTGEFFGDEDEEEAGND